MDEENQKCLLCGEIAILMAENQVGYKKPELFSIWHCPNCKTAFSMPRVNSDNIYELIYLNAEKLRGYSDYRKLQLDIKIQKKPLQYLQSRSIVYWVIERIIKKQAKRSNNMSILEVGSGYGYLTYALKKAGYNVTGLDISHEAVCKAIDCFGNYFICEDVYEYSKRNNESVDIIILTEVIEHIEKPVEFIKVLSDLLKKDGILFLTTPNKSYFPSNTIWSGENPPVHCWWYSEESMQYIASILNLDIDIFDFSNVYQVRMARTLKEPIVHPYALDENGIPIIENYTSSNFGGIIPKRFKNTWIYRNISKIIYPIIAKLFYSPQKRNSILCVTFTKK